MTENAALVLFSLQHGVNAAGQNLPLFSQI
jgi:hypothetical protein